MPPWTPKMERLSFCTSITLFFLFIGNTLTYSLSAHILTFFERMTLLLIITLSVLNSNYVSYVILSILMLSVVLVKSILVRSEKLFSLRRDEWKRHACTSLFKKIYTPSQILKYIITQNSKYIQISKSSSFRWLYLMKNC